MRYAWPSELDLMARIAGLRLRDVHERIENSADAIGFLHAVREGIHRGAAVRARCGGTPYETPRKKTTT